MLSFNDSFFEALKSAIIKSGSMTSFNLPLLPKILFRTGLKVYRAWSLVVLIHYL
jgi:hypothetical protein